MCQVCDIGLQFALRADLDSHRLHLGETSLLGFYTQRNSGPKNTVTSSGPHAKRRGHRQTRTRMGAPHCPLTLCCHSLSLGRALRPRPAPSVNSKPKLLKCGSLVTGKGVTVGGRARTLGEEGRRGRMGRARRRRAGGRQTGNSPPGKAQEGRFWTFSDSYRQETRAKV